MISELLSLAYDVAGLIPGMAEAEKIIAIGQDAYAALQAVEVFLATPQGKDLEKNLGVLVKPASVQIAGQPFVLVGGQYGVRGGPRGGLMPPGV